MPSGLFTKAEFKPKEINLVHLNESIATELKIYDLLLPKGTPTKYMDQTVYVDLPDEGIRCYKKFLTMDVYWSLVNSGFLFEFDVNAQTKLKWIYENVKHNNYLVKKLENIAVYSGNSSEVIDEIMTSNPELAQKEEQSIEHIPKAVQIKELTSEVKEVVKDYTPRTTFTSYKDEKRKMMIKTILQILTRIQSIIIQEIDSIKVVPPAIATDSTKSIPN